MGPVVEVAVYDDNSVHHMGVGAQSNASEVCCKNQQEKYPYERVMSS